MLSYYTPSFDTMYSMKDSCCTLYIVRHGETDWNMKGLVQGHTDIPLNKKGEMQAGELGKMLNHLRFNVAFSSDLLRAKQTAEIILLEKAIAVQTTKALRERYFGSYEGIIVQELDKKIKQFIHASQHMQSEIESDESLMKRLIPFLREVSVGYPGKKVLMTTHGGVMRALLIRLGFGTDETLPFGSIKNTAFIKLESDGIDFFVRETYGIEKKSKFSAP